MIILGNIESRCGFENGIDILNNGGVAIDCVVDTITQVENNLSVKTVGYGGYPNLLGDMELDACLIDGTTRKTGAVGGMKQVCNPIQTARHVMDKLPHEILIGDGADRFAHECGQPAQSALTDDARMIWAERLKEHITDAQWAEFENQSFSPGTLTYFSGLTQDPETVESPKDTTIVLAMDSHNNITAGGSTSGWAWKYPGRLGDCPIVGAGLYAQSKVGAIGCTHMGEMSIRSGTARYILTLMEYGCDLQAAMYKGANDLKEVYQNCEIAPQEGVVIHGIDKHCKHFVLAVNCPETIEYWYWTPQDGICKSEATYI